MKTKEEQETEIYQEIRSILSHAKDDFELSVNEIVKFHLENLDLYAEQFKPKWISVEERLPENKKSVLIICGKIQCVGFYTKGFEVIVEDEDGEGDYDSDESKDGLYLKPGWYEEQEQEQARDVYDYISFSRNPTHWMPLPTFKP